MLAIAAGVTVAAILLTQKSQPDVENIRVPVYLAYNGNIYTVDTNLPSASAFVVDSHGLFYDVGDTEALINNPNYTSLPRFDLEGKTVLPGFGDAHAHLSALGMSILEPDLRGTTSASDVVRVLKQYCLQHNIDPLKDKGTYLMGRGWDQTEWGGSGEFPTANDLDNDFPGLAIVLERIDGHALWANTAAMKVIQPIPDADPEGGKIVRNSTTGLPTGIFIDSAMDLLYDTPYADIEPETLKKAIGLAIRECSSLGITHMHDAAMELEDHEMYGTIINAGK